MAEQAERYELHYQDETHVETNPYLAKQRHRIGVQQRIASVGVNRRVTVCGSVEDGGRGRVAVVCGGQDSVCVGQYLAALDQRHEATEREVYLVLLVCLPLVARPLAIASSLVVAGGAYGYLHWWFDARPVWPWWVEYGSRAVALAILLAWGISMVITAHGRRRWGMAVPAGLEPTT